MDLTTTYLGLALRNPLVASASPLSQSVAGVERLAAAGVGAIVLPSLFEEQVREEAERTERLLDHAGELSAESLTMFPPPPDGSGHATRYLSLVRRAAEAVDVPVIASLNGVTAGGWIHYAAELQAAGAAAVELNIYHLPGDPRTTGREVEARHLEILTAVKAAVTVPVAVKLTPYFSSIGDMALRLDEAGADGLVLFNRFMQPDVDTETLKVTAVVELSQPVEARLPRAWIALLSGRVRASLAATTGVEDATDVVKFLLAGADVVMTASALLRHDPGYARVMLDGLRDWMDRKGFQSVADLRGRLRVPVEPDQAGFERSRYVAAMHDARQRYGP
ncbi:dihydroorotate dehydrogenase (fumarate) [Krasilnikovia cinnamomea]|uniref:Dihydroorotate dehydrogenase (Fumarate) n=1 Tax=Krasilnikovia cinnamomea TaxID=349313 RepID=A0A4Q7ZRU7_9ACTN|nr:dihydroorotate dehydrogenase-like protein [Krasilnikovia cinnamomea]RZU53225.1 dihydroorotate dehydrogenase (fumarate) [Krasilnikovia cinnamomea]